MRAPRSRRLAGAAAGFAAALLPAFALADPITPIGSPVLSLKTGPAYTLTQSTISLGYGAVFFAFVLALFFEMAHEEHRHHYGPIVVRTFLVLIGLHFYGTIFGSVVTTATAIGNHVTPQQAFTQFYDDSRVKLGRLMQGDRTDVDPGWGTQPAGSPLQPAANQPPAPAPSAFDTLKNGWARTGTALGGMVFSSILSILIVLCLVIHKLFGLFGAVLLGFLYAVGPLVLSTAVLRQAGVFGTWFRHLVTIACWPIVSGLLTQLCFGVIQQWNQNNEAYQVVALFNAVVIVALALVTPALTSSLIGGMGNVASPGLEMMTAAVAFTAWKAQSALVQYRNDRDQKEEAEHRKDQAHGHSTSSSGAAGSAGGGLISNPVMGATGALRDPGAAPAARSASSGDERSPRYADGQAAAGTMAASKPGEEHRAEVEAGVADLSARPFPPNPREGRGHLPPGGHEAGDAVAVSAPLRPAAGGDTHAAAPRARAAGNRPIPGPRDLEPTKEAAPDDLIRAGAAHPPVGPSLKPSLRAVSPRSSESPPVPAPLVAAGARDSGTPVIRRRPTAAHPSPEPSPLPKPPVTP